ncbi:cytidine deaminase family protein, partial [Hydrogenimonas sp.]
MNLFDELVALLERSDAPFSGFSVAAVVVDEAGRHHLGVNVESASYGLTICAERAAIFSAIAAGMARGGVREVHLLARTHLKNPHMRKWHAIGAI